MNTSKFHPISSPRTSIFMLPILIFLLLLFPSLALAQETGNILKKKIIIGTELLYPPYSFLDNNGDPSGFNVELTNAIAGIVGLDMEIRIGPWGEIRNDLETKELDSIVGMYYSRERDKKVDFSSAFTIVEHSVFLRAGSHGFTSLDDLRGKEIIVMSGDIMHDYALKEGWTKSLILADTIPEVLRLLSSGKHDYAMVAKAPGLYWLKELKLSNINAIGKPLLPSKYCYAVIEGNQELLSKFNEGLANLKQTGRYAKIYDKWLGSLESQESSKDTILLYIFLPLALIFLLITFRSKLGLGKK